MRELSFIKQNQIPRILLNKKSYFCEAMRKINFRYILTRIKHLLTNPEAEWLKIKEEDSARDQLFRDYVIIPSALFSILVVLLRLLNTDLMIAVGWGVINFISCTIGTYICFRASKEYLSNKIQNHGKIAIYLSIYSSAIFIVFHSLSVGFTHNFIGDVMAILSLFSLRTLYTGLNTISTLNTRFKKSAVIIIGLLIICTPVIIMSLLTIVFRIPAINA